MFRLIYQPSPSNFMMICGISPYFNFTLNLHLCDEPKKFRKIRNQEFYLSSSSSFYVLSLNFSSHKI